MTNASNSQCLYRFYDSAGTLLYIGITSKLPSRIRQHNRDKLWWTEVASTTVEHFPTREAVGAAEKAAIKNERPRYNKADNVVAGQGGQWVATARKAHRTAQTTNNITSRPTPDRDDRWTPTVDMVPLWVVLNASSTAVHLYMLMTMNLRLRNKYARNHYLKLLKITSDELDEAHRELINLDAIQRVDGKLLIHFTPPDGFALPVSAADVVPQPPPCKDYSCGSCWDENTDNDTCISEAA